MKANRILVGDVVEQLKTLPDECVNCVVTSPPYFGLRDYGTGQWEGGDPNCDHSIPSGEHDPKRSGGDSGSSHTIRFNRERCHRCGAKRVDRQIGLEDSPDEYVQRLVEVFREVRRLLRDDGTVWLNLGDSYNGSGGNHKEHHKNDAGFQGKVGARCGGRGAKVRHGYKDGRKNRDKRLSIGHDDCLKPKDLMGIPWRVAFALQADGWYLRQDIIWCLSGGMWLYVRTKKGDMPMMVKDVARLDPFTVQLWNGEKWTQLLGMSKSARRGDELEIVLRSGERISCTPTHRFPTGTGVVDAGDLKPGDVLVSCRLPEPEAPRDFAIDEDAAWFAGLYIAEGSRSGDTIQISGHTKENERWQRVQSIAEKFGGSATLTNDRNNQAIRVYGKVLSAIIDELVAGRTSLDKGFASVVWRYSNRFIAAMLDGYLSGDGHKDGNRWRLSFCRNYNLERDLRTACARLGYTLTLNLASVAYDGKRVATFRGELRKERNGHHNERDRNEIVEIRKARCRNVYDIGVEDEPHLFALASGVLTHNSKPNPMPESVRDRCTKSHEYIFLLSKSKSYYYDSDAIKEKSIWYGKDGRSDGGNFRYEGKRTSGDQKKNGQQGFATVTEKRNKRSVWSVSTKPYAEAHFAVFPEALIEPCIKAGCPRGGVVLDPFFGSGTTGLVASKLSRNWLGVELNEEYVVIAEKRLAPWKHQTRLTDHRTPAGVNHINDHAEQSDKVMR